MVRARLPGAALTVLAMVGCGLTVLGEDAAPTAGPSDAASTGSGSSGDGAAFGGGDGAGGVVVLPDGATVVVDASSPTDGGRDAPPTQTQRCQGTQPPESIRVDDFCIDRTEVTRSQYAAFLAVASTSNQIALCSWNTTFGGVPTPVNDLPITDVDWCDANAYCAWAGKHLCSKTESRRGCSAGSQRYPYGDSYQTNRCNDSNGARGGPVAVGSLMCASALGVSDMLGNVWEWIDGCTGTSGSNDSCFFGTGGAWNHNYHCDQTATGFVRASRASDVGFRCCADYR